MDPSKAFIHCREPRQSGFPVDFKRKHGRKDEPSKIPLMRKNADVPIFGAQFPLNKFFKVYLTF